MKKDKIIKLLKKEGVSQEVIDQIIALLDEPEAKTQDNEPGPGPGDPDPGP